MAVQYQLFPQCQPVAAGANATIAASLLSSGVGAIILAGAGDAIIAAGISSVGAGSGSVRTPVVGAGDTSIGAGLASTANGLVILAGSADASIAGAMSSAGAGTVIVAGTGNSSMNAGMASTGAGNVAAGTVTPGTTCGNAPTITLPFSATYDITGPTTNQTFRFAGTSGQLYHWRLTTNSGTFGGAGWTHGDCPGTTIAPPPSSITPCVTFTPGSNENVNLQVAGPGSGTWNYTIDVATGAC